jgi:phage shock protein A
MDELNAPATKGDIALLKGDVARLGEKIEQILGRVADSEARLDEKIEQLRSETNTSYAGLVERMADGEARLDEKIEQLRSEVNHGYADIVERMADGETRLLKAFYGFAQSNQNRVAELEGNEAAIRNRLGALENRILEVEKRLNMPPAA